MLSILRSRKGIKKMTEERLQLFLDALNSDLEYAKKIVQLDIQEMTNSLNQKGYDFTQKEIEEVGRIFREIANRSADENGELSEGVMKHISGGVCGIKEIIDIFLFINDSK